jgi:hypothetical protein
MEEESMHAGNRGIGQWLATIAAVGVIGANTARAADPPLPSKPVPMAPPVEIVIEREDLPETVSPGHDAQQPTEDVAPDGPSEPGTILSRVPPVTRFPRPGWFIITPSGPGYYSALDFFCCHLRKGPPKYPYPRYSLMHWSFFDADFRYLDNPDNTEHDFFDPLKRIEVNDTFLFSTGGEFRYRWNHEVDSRLSGKDDNYDLTRLRIYGDAWFQDVFRVYVEFIDAQTFNQDLVPLPIDHNFGDLQNLFADLKVYSWDDHPVYFRAGRQELLYGSQRLISPLEWANTRRTFQGGKLFYRSDTDDFDVFVVQPIVPRADRFDTVDDQQVFSGAWYTHRSNENKNALDIYYLNLDQARHVATGNHGLTGGFNLSTMGFRSAGEWHNFLWDEEDIIQLGPWANQKTRAGSFTSGLGYRFADVPMTPQLWLYYDYATGDPHPGIGSLHRTFNQLFPFAHYYFGYIDVVGRQNIGDLNTQLTFYPTKWITVLLQYHAFRLAEAKDALYSAAGVPLRRDPTGKAGTDVGDEIDLAINFHLDKHQDIYIDYSHLYAGAFIKQTGSPRSPDYVYLQYSFRW